MFKWIKQLRCKHEYHIVDQTEDIFEFHKVLAKYGNVSINKIKQSWIDFKNNPDNHIKFKTECKKCNKFLCNGMQNKIPYEAMEVPNIIKMERRNFN